MSGSEAKKVRGHRPEPRRLLVRFVSFPSALRPRGSPAVPGRTREAVQEPSRANLPAADVQFAGPVQAVCVRVGSAGRRAGAGQKVWTPASFAHAAYRKRTPSPPRDDGDGGFSDQERASTKHVHRRPSQAALLERRLDFRYPRRPLRAVSTDNLAGQKGRTPPVSPLSARTLHRNPRFLTRHGLLALFAPGERGRPFPEGRRYRAVRCGFQAKWALSAIKRLRPVRRRSAPQLNAGRNSLVARRTVFGILPAMRAPLPWWAEAHFANENTSKAARLALPISPAPTSW